MPPPPAILRDLLSTDVMVQALPPGNLHVCVILSSLHHVLSTGTNIPKRPSQLAAECSIPAACRGSGVARPPFPSPVPQSSQPPLVGDPSRTNEPATARHAAGERAWRARTRALHTQVAFVRRSAFSQARAGPPPRAAHSAGRPAAREGPPFPPGANSDGTWNPKQ